MATLTYNQPTPVITHIHKFSAALNANANTTQAERNVATSATLVISNILDFWVHSENVLIFKPHSSPLMRNIYGTWLVSQGKC